MHISAEIEMGIEREADGTGDGVTSEMDVDGDFFCSSLLPSLSYNLFYIMTLWKRGMIVYTYAHAIGSRHERDSCMGNIR